MKLSLFFSLLFIAFNLFAQSGNYYKRSAEFGFASPSVFKQGLYGYHNPAALSLAEGTDFYLTWQNYHKDDTEHNGSWGIFTAAPHFGFSALNGNSSLTGEGLLNLTEYNISTSLGDNTSSFGLGYGWNNSPVGPGGYNDYLSYGMILRGLRLYSFGAFGKIFDNGYSEGVLELGIRPLGDEKLTLFGDYLISTEHPRNMTNYSFGAIIEPLEGIRIAGRYFEDHSFNVGVQVSAGNAGYTYKGQFDDNGRIYESHGIRIGTYDRNYFSKLWKDNYVIGYDLGKGLSYRKFKYFDDSYTLLEILQDIRLAREQESVAGIFIDATGFVSGKETLWELRHELEEFQKAGKKIIISLDNADINLYHFASVADMLIMDPMGMLMLTGYSMGKNYYKGLLEKLGIGFDEWRYFEYKSALESFSREKMSSADSLQRYELIEDFYNLAAGDISKSRNVSLDEFADLVNNDFIISAAKAEELGLIDTSLAKDNIDYNKLLEKTFNNNTPQSDYTSYSITGNRVLEKKLLPQDTRWEEKPEISVIYALGTIGMNSGMNAEMLARVIRGVAHNGNSAAVVIRVDSPGGSALASEVIARAIDECKKYKPVIISQGSVAASGGYWISMKGDTILAAPNTITGSIGVIGGWAYNKGLKEKLGVSTDLVKIGEHADLGYGMYIPFTGLSLPDRNLTEAEKEIISKQIHQTYNLFVEKVAENRDMDTSAVYAIAEGRVWSGEDAREIGLVDEIGGLQDAVDIALGEAGITDGYYELKEYPEAPFFDLSVFMPRLISADVASDPVVSDLVIRMDNNGKPMLILPIDINVEVLKEWSKKRTNYN